MASSSVSQEDHDVEHDFALASRRAKVRSARANRTVNSTNYSLNTRAEDFEREVDDGSLKFEPNSSVVLVEQNDASPKPISRGIAKDKRVVNSYSRGGHAGKCNKGVRDRRKLREKRRSTGVMHLPSTESTGGSTGEDENNENSSPISTPVVAACKLQVSGVEFEEKVTISSKTGRSESDLDADDEANNSGEVRGDRDELGVVKGENERLCRLLEVKDKRISALEIQLAQLTRQMSELREENVKLSRTIAQHRK